MPIRAVDEEFRHIFNLVQSSPIILDIEADDCIQGGNISGDVEAQASDSDMASFRASALAVHQKAPRRRGQKEPRLSAVAVGFPMQAPARALGVTLLDQLIIECLRIPGKLPRHL